MTTLLHQNLEKTAQRNPEAPALRFHDAAWSYAQLDSTANQVAHVLHDHGVQPGDRIGIYRQKGLETVAAMYGILKAGAAFVPIDPWTPVDRIDFLLRDCGISLLVTADSKLRHLRKSQQRPTLLGASPNDEFPTVSWESIAAYPTTPPRVRQTELDIAYILHTSGSTGEPKGMVHTHRSGLTFVQWAVDHFDLSPTDRLGNHAPLHFDLSILDLVAAHTAGASTSIVPEEFMKVPAELSRWIESERLTVWYSVPAALIHMLLRGQLDDRDWSRLRLVLFGGEPTPVEQLVRLMDHAPNARFCHMYGVTEANVTNCYFVPRPLDPTRPLPVGAPLQTFDTMLLDGDEPTATETGELAVRGPALMRGYWRRPELTPQVYWYRQLPDGSEARYYRTGDLLRVTPAGDWLYAGRVDRQIKSRGHRIELDEVQTAIESHSAIAEAAVFDIPDAEGSKELAAAVTLRDGAAYSQESLLRHLRQRLPVYAIPPEIRVVPQMPRTSAGKTDWQALRHISAAQEQPA